MQQVPYIHILSVTRISISTSKFNQLDRFSTILWILFLNESKQKPPPGTFQNTRIYSLNCSLPSTTTNQPNNQTSNQDNRNNPSVPTLNFTMLIARCSVIISKNKYTPSETETFQGVGGRGVETALKRYL